MPSPPSNLTALTTGKTKVSLRWLDETGAFLYRIFYNTLDDFASATVAGFQNQGQGIFEVTGLLPGTTYFFFVQTEDNPPDISLPTASVSATTTGSAGIPGVNVVEQIVNGAKARLATVTPAEAHLLEYVREPEKNSREGRKFGYGVMPKVAEPGEPAKFTSYTITQEFFVLLSRGIQKKKDEREIEQGEAELYTLADSIIKDFKLTKLFETDVIVRIGDPSIDEPEFLEAQGLLVLRIIFPITYRQNLN